MVRIRMQRFGRTNRPFYRIAAIEKRARRNGPVIESLGFYDPIEKDPAKAIRLNEERLKHWLSKGAQPSDTLRDMLAKRGMVDVKSWEQEREYDRNKVKENLAKAAAAGEKKDEKKS